jgi:hypothetical protein
VVLVIQLEVLSGRQAGLLHEARHFPILVGRAAANALQLEDDGVWAEHFQLAVDPKNGFTLTARPGALVMVNELPAEAARLKNGDVITAGAARLRFRLSPTEQRGLHGRELLVWTLLLSVTISQLGLVLWLLGG